MSLRKRGNIWYYRFMVEGQTYEGSCKTKDKKLAAEFEDARKRDVYRQQLTGQPMATPEMLLSEAVDRIYRERWASQKAGEHTRKRAESLVRLMDDPMLDEIDSKAVIALRQTLEGREPATVNRYMATLKTILNVAYKEWEVIEKVPVIRMAKEQHRIRTVSQPEQVQVVTYFTERGDNEMADLVVTLADTGMRLSECLTLRPSQLYLEDRYVHLPDTKSGEPRDIPLTSRVTNILRHRSTSTKVWTLSVDQVERKWQTMRRDLGITDKSFVLHALRHTTATRLIDLGEDISVVKRLLGHSTIVTTQRYVNLDRRRVAAAVSRLETRETID